MYKFSVLFLILLLGLSGVYSSECGLGQASSDGFPWIVDILTDIPSVKSRSSVIRHCSGSLIHAQAVLTAGRCVEKLATNQLRVRENENVHDINEVIIHPNITLETGLNDIAILKLKKPLKLTENVSVICLPDSNDNFASALCYGPNWHTNKTVESRVSCQNALRWKTGGSFSRHYKLPSGYICASPKTTCGLHLGSPLVCPLSSHPNRYVQAGIFTTTIGCHKNKIPTIFVSTSDARNWINEKLAKF